MSLKFAFFVASADGQSGHLRSNMTETAQATKADIMHKFGDSFMRSLCLKVCPGGQLDSTSGAWFVDESGRPNPETAMKPALLTSIPSAITWTGLNTPKVSQTTATQDCDNRLNSNVMQACRSNIKVEQGTSMTHSTTTKAGFIQQIVVEAKIPDMFKVTSTSTFSVNTEDTTVKKDSSSTTINADGSVLVPAHQAKCLKVAVTTETYSSTYSLPVCVSGQFGCNFPKKCNDHYFWYNTFEGLAGASRCSTIRGTVSARTNAHSSVAASDGMCPKGQQDVLV